jgi:hypothetical protein
MAGRQVNFDAVPDTGVVDPGIYQVAIGELEETASKSGKLMYNARIEIIEPTDFAGMGIFESFVIGSDDDPDAQEETTWNKSVGCRRLKQMLKAAQVPLDNDMDNVVAAALQQQLVVSVTQEVDDGSRDPQYVGRVRNRIGAFYQLGHKEVGVAPAAPAKPATPKAVAPKPPLAVTPKANLAPGQQLAPAPKAAPPPRPPAAPQAAKPAAPKPAAAAKAPTAHCTICDTDVLRSEFADHVEAHANEA